MTSAADELTIALVLVAALLHASWNALAKASGDPLVNIAIQTSTGGLIGVPLMLWLPWPGPETWRWLALSAVLHFLYELNLARMYRLGDLSQVYPIARGLAPLGVALLGALFVEERLAWTQVAGLVVSGCAIVVLGRSGGGSAASRRAVTTALVVALLIGLYTYSDGRGVRSEDDPFVYIAWSMFVGCVPLAAFTVVVRRQRLREAFRSDARRAVFGGMMATVGYGIALWAMSRTPLALVASLRESSVLFAALIGALLLRESFGLRRILASAALVVGIVLVQIEFG